MEGYNECYEISILSSFWPTLPAAANPGTNASQPKAHSSSSTRALATLIAVCRAWLPGALPRHRRSSKSLLQLNFFSGSPFSLFYNPVGASAGGARLHFIFKTGTACQDCLAAYTVRLWSVHMHLFYSSCM